MTASKGFPWLTGPGYNRLKQILMFAKISFCLLKIAWLKSRVGQHFCHCCQTAKNSHIRNSLAKVKDRWTSVCRCCQTAKGSHITNQLMHSIEVNIRICQPSKVMFTPASSLVNITFSGWHILMLSSIECINYVVSWVLIRSALHVNFNRMHRLCNVLGTHKKRLTCSPQ